MYAKIVVVDTTNGRKTYITNEKLSDKKAVMWAVGDLKVDEALGITEILVGDTSSFKVVDLSTVKLWKER